MSADFTTDNVDLAAAISCRLGGKPVIELGDGTDVNFIFPKSPRIEEVARLFSEADLMVEIRSFNYHRARLARQLRQLRQKRKQRTEPHNSPTRGEGVTPR